MFTFIVGFLGIGIAIGLPVILLISRQASSQAQLLLDQAVVASLALGLFSLILVLGSDWLRRKEH